MPETQLQHPYLALAHLPRTLWLPSVTTACGQPQQRLQDCAHWLAALNAGALPDPQALFGSTQAGTALAGTSRELAAQLRQAVGELGLPSLAKGLPAVGEQVLRTVLWHLGHALDLQPRLSPQSAHEHVLLGFKSAWVQEKAGLQAQLALLRQLGLAPEGMQLSWDSLAGQARARDWQAAQRAAQRLAALPELATLLERLGRCVARPAPLARRSKQAPPQADATHKAPLRAVPMELPDAPGELTGIRLNASLVHMLPSEAALLAHPSGRRLWRARLAERRLLGYETLGRFTDWRQDPQAHLHLAPPAHEQQALERGPIVLCLDTSGSMQGAPESIAKAVALAAVRAARASGRALRLLAFGASGELMERTLANPSQGLASKAEAESELDALLSLMGQSFDGGTDIQTPIERAIATVHEAGWASADVLIVSDGEFGCVPATLALLERTRQALGVHVQGILVGDRETLGLLDVCDAIHWVRDWRRHADEAAGHTEARKALPVHSKSLTALYFPNALSPQAQRHHRVAPQAQ